jgi:hypothetical protein
VRKGVRCCFLYCVCAESKTERSVSDFHQGHLHVFTKRHSIMRKLDVGPTIDAASWRSVDGGVYARVPKGVYCCH